MKNIISIIRNYRFRKHLSKLVENGLKIGKNVHVFDGVFLDPSHCFLISIGDNCTIAPNVRLIAHDASTKTFLGIVKIGMIKIQNNCFLGDSVIVLPGVTIGPNVIIGAGSVVTRDIPPDSVATGNPAKVISTIGKFLEKHKEDKNKYRCFIESQYEIDNISDKNKEEMLYYLAGNIGYMIDRENAE